MRRGRGDNQLRLRSFRFADLDAVSPGVDFAREMASLSDDQRRALTLSIGFTLERGTDLAPRRVLACGGAREQRPGLWSVWCYADDLTAREWAVVAQAGRRLFDFIETTLEARSLEMLVDLANPAALRFARKLGFAETGDLSARAGAAYRVMVREQD